ncbi:Ser/Thr protein phosphatase family protein [Lachnospiraceae bacterium TWA4]|nr:Ser/Thr protein phosphatase family protein [Lachnospiraceae bacterium TWA4]
MRDSFEQARKDGYTKFLMFLHYPPTNILEEESVFTKIAKEYGVEHVVYSHCHGDSRFHDSIIGQFQGIWYHLVSGDYLKFKPERII